MIRSAFVQRAVALLLAGWPLLAGIAAAQNFPPPPPLESPIAGAIDFHVHSSPDVFGRSMDDLQAARIAAANGLRAIVLKNHVTGTADRAEIVSRLVPGIEAFGGITLNRAVGGVNAHAVEWMYRISGGRGRVVWLPSFEADHHHKTFGEPGEGLKVAIDGRVTPEMEAVLKVIAREDLVLSTCHVSPEETLAVIRRGRELGVKRILVTHAFARVPGLNLDQARQAAGMGAYLELAYVNHIMGPNAHFGWMRSWPQVSISQMAASIKAIGAKHFVLSSDLGQTGNPVHPDGYKILVAGFKAEGISDGDLDLMMRKNPAYLLRLDE